MRRCLLILLSLIALMGLVGSVQAQEIEARTYSNAPIDYNFLGAGFTQVQSNNKTLSSELLSYNRIFDFFGQSGKLNVVLPYAQLHGTAKAGPQTVSGSAQGLTDPVIRVAANLYGAPALTFDEFKSYQQDLIIGANLAVSLPWGSYNSNQLFNVGANRSFIQPGLGFSQAKGPWRFELSGDATYFSDNPNFYGGNIKSQNPIYSTTGHVLYYFPSTAWLSTDITYYSGGQSFINGRATNNSEQNWLFGVTLSLPVNAHNAIKLHASEGSFMSAGQNYTMYGVVWQYRWGDGGK